MRRHISTAAKLTEQQRASRKRTSPREASRGDGQAKASGQARAKWTQRGTRNGAAHAKNAANGAERQKYVKRRAHDEGVTRTKSRTGEASGSRLLEKFGRKSRVVLVAICIVVLVCIILYPVGKDYYHSVRDGQRLQAQVDAVKERNETLEEETDALNTDEGIEAQARDDYNYVKKGENAVVVTNAQSNDRSTDLPAQIDEDDIQAPQTWYYSILDVIFLYGS